MLLILLNCLRLTWPAFQLQVTHPLTAASVFHQQFFTTIFLSTSEHLPQGICQNQMIGVISKHLILLFENI